MAHEVRYPLQIGAACFLGSGPRIATLGSHTMKSPRATTGVHYLSQVNTKVATETATKESDEEEYDDDDESITESQAEEDEANNPDYAKVNDPDSG
jgi:hypothetical protein